MLYVDQVDVDRPVQVRDWTGERVPAHAVSSGLVALSTLSEPDREAYLAGPLDRRRGAHDDEPDGAATADPGDRPRATEWAIEEYLEGINSVAARRSVPTVASLRSSTSTGRRTGSRRRSEADDVAAIVAAGASRIASRLGGRPALDAV